MGIIYGDIYKNYFPLKEQHTKFTYAEKLKLSKWAKTFKDYTLAALLSDDINNSKNGIQIRYILYGLDNYEVEKIMNMIKENQFDEEGLLWINCIIYSHKYSSLLSYFFSPILTYKHYKYLINN